MKKHLLFFSLILSNLIIFGQNKTEGIFHGNFEINLQSYSEDSSINAPEVSEKVRTNAFANFTYSKDKLNFGVRYEAYLNSMLGYDERYNGQGIAYRYGTYIGDEIEITAGNFYEQFGSGMILRTYEDKSLGYDNAFDGFRVKYRPVEGLRLTGLIGKQKLFFDYGNGIVRAADIDMNINQLIDSLKDKKTKLQVGASFVSKFQEADDPIYNYPENVSAFAGRFQLSRNKIILKGEYAYKINDPSGDNLYDFTPDDANNAKSPIFKNGQGLFLNLSYSQKGFGILLTGMSLDNMSFRSDRFATGNDLNINYLPALSKNHTYTLAAVYPFSTQAEGEIGSNLEIFYKIPRKSMLGGKYGMHISLNYAQINALEKTDILIDPKLYGYTSDLYNPSDDVYFREYGIEIYKKITKKVKLTTVYLHQLSDIEVILGKVGEEEVIADIFISDISYKINRKHALRLETQGLFSKQYTGNWAFALLEYTVSPHWFISISDQYNYDNPHADNPVHYYNAYAGYVKNGNRIQIAYGRQREGIICVGGVCRNVPASNGFSLTLTSSF